MGKTASNDYTVYEPILRAGGAGSRIVSYVGHNPGCAGEVVAEPCTCGLRQAVAGLKPPANLVQDLKPWAKHLGGCDPENTGSCTCGLSLHWPEANS